MKGGLKKKMVELEFIKLEFYVEYFPRQMPSVGSPLGSRVLKTRVQLELNFLKLEMLVF